MKPHELKQIIKEEIGKVLNENFYGKSLKKLPEKAYTALSYEFDVDDPEVKESLLFIKKWIKTNLNGLERGMSVYYLSNKGEDFKEVCEVLECETDDIIDHIHSIIDEILGY
jgi:tRNA pseudouridine-54 N-methylase